MKNGDGSYDFFFVRGRRFLWGRWDSHREDLRSGRKNNSDLQFRTHALQLVVFKRRQKLWVSAWQTLISTYDVIAMETPSFFY